MEKTSQAQRVLFQKDRYYERATKLVRWLAIALVLVTFPPSSPNNLLVYGLATSAILYNLARYSKWLMRLQFFSSKINMLVMDNFFVLVLTILTGGLYSPYYLFFVFMITSSAYWYGIGGLAVVTAFQAAATLLIATEVTTLRAPDGPLALAAVVILTLIVEGVLVERLTQADRQERFLAAESRDQLETERQRLLGFINSLADAAIAVSDKGKITLYNGAALDLFNTNAELTGKNLGSILPLTDQSQTTVDIMSVARKTTGNQKRNDLVFLTSEGSKINLDLSIAPIYGTQSGHQFSSGYVLIMRDITKEKTLEQQRDEFISVTSHELRTPLAIAEANLSTALLPSIGKIDPKARELLEQAHQNVIFLGDLIRDLTTLSRVEQGELAVDLKLIEPEQLLEQLARDYQAEAKTNGLTLKVKTSPGLNSILTSEYRVHEILQNFITNAIKYTHKGGVILSAVPATDDSSSIVFSVKDSGIGISTTDKKKVFQKFFRSEDFRTRQTGGTGLGLYITQKLADRLNGKIWYTSELNKGSTFYLQVPPFSQRKQDRSQVIDAQMETFVSSI